VKTICTLCQVAGGIGLAVALFIAVDLRTQIPSDYGAPNVCFDNLLHVIGGAMTTWAHEHGGQYPFNVSTNAGGTLEFCARDNDGFDSNAAVHFCAVGRFFWQSPAILVCPDDHGTKAAQDFETLMPENLTYKMRTGTNINMSNLVDSVIVCPIHLHTMRASGEVLEGQPNKSLPTPSILNLWRYSPSFRERSWQVLLSGTAAVFFLSVGTHLKRRKRKSMAAS
jgi:hypothetical protein